MKAKIIPFAFIASLFIASCAGMPEQEMETRDIAAYDVSDGEMVPEPQEEGAAPSVAQIRLHRELWDHSLALIPDEYEHYVDRFVLSSDGLENIMAYVEPACDEDETADLSSWTLAVDLVDSHDHLGRLRSHELSETVVHEFGHLLSLNSSQARALNSEEAGDPDWMEHWDFGKSYRSYDCVSLEDSYLNRFFHEFWSAEQVKEWFALDGEEDEEAWFAALSDLSIRYHTDFVSDYAMTNVEEDFAESFTWFILYDKPEGELVSHHKILFFYDFPELVAMRDEIRAALSEDLLAAKRLIGKSSS